MSAAWSDCRSRGFVHRRTNSLRRGKPTTLPSKRRKRKARRRDERDGVQGSSRGLFAPCRHHHLLVKTPQLCSWDRHAKFKLFPSVNTPPAVPFLGSLTSPPPVSRPTSASRPMGVAREEEGTESSGLLQVPLGLFLFNLHSLGQRSRSSPGAAWRGGVLRCVLEARHKERGFAPALVEGSPWQRERVLCPPWSCPPTVVWRSVLLLCFYF